MEFAYTCCLNNYQVYRASTAKILLGFMIATGFLSMFVSNTAAVMIMIPIGLAIIKEANELNDKENTKSAYTNLKNL